MRFFILLLLAFPLLSVGQALKDNYFYNSEAGLSIKFDKEWKVKIPETGNLVFAAISKHQTISVGLLQLTSSYIPNYTQEEADEAKEQYVIGLNARKVIIHKISASPGNFQGKKCIITIAHITQPGFNDNVPVYHKLIQFLHRGNMINVLYFLPLSNISKLNEMEKQIKTMKFF